VVVIDVLRAFSTAAYAFAAGVESITLAGTVEEAFALSEQLPGALVMGEVGGLPVPGFDLGNSPSEIVQRTASGELDLQGCRLVHRTTHGVQGFLRSSAAERLLGGSLVVAGATARLIQSEAPDRVTFVLTGIMPDGSGDEDAACADYLEALLSGRQPDPRPYLRRVLDSAPGRLFADPARPEYPAADLEYCTALDRFDFALPVEPQAGRLVMGRTIVKETDDEG
jgi:2-phosphosulfolactate phosphatase